MAVHIQVRDVPDAVFLALKARAAGSGRPLSEFLRELLEQAAAGPAKVVAPRAADSPVVASD